MRMSDLPSVSVETTIDADPSAIYAVVDDLDVMAGFGTEFQRGEWVSGRPGELGSVFVGHQKSGDREWRSTSTITEREPDRVFGWAVGDPEEPVAQWTFTLRRVPDGTDVRYDAVLGSGESGLTAAIAARPDSEEAIIDKRLAHLQDNMVKTLEGIRRRVERR